MVMPEIPYLCFNRAMSLVKASLSFLFLFCWLFIKEALALSIPIECVPSFDRYKGLLGMAELPLGITSACVQDLTVVPDLRFS